MQDAMASCAKLAKLEEYRVELFPKNDEPWKQVLRVFGVSLRSASLGMQLEAQFEQVRAKIQTYGGIQARETLIL
jgi:hypothetical protein